MKLGFAGAGNMAAAIARGLAAHGGHPEMLFTDSGSGRAAALAAELDGVHAASLAELAEDSDAILLLVKPAALDAAAEGLAGFSGPLVSMLGATTVAQVEDVFPDCPVLRAMPNVAIEVGRGVICHAPAAVPEPLAEVLELLGRAATIFELPEQQLDPATAVMGCSPAFLAVACRALADAGQAAGLDRELSARLVSLAAAGTGELLLEHDPDAVQRAVASPGGSTEAGLEALASHGAEQAFAAAVGGALERMAGNR